MLRQIFAPWTAPGWTLVLLSQAERVYRLIDAWSNYEFLRDKARGGHFQWIEVLLASPYAQAALILLGFAWVIIVARRQPPPRKTAAVETERIEPVAARPMRYAGAILEKRMAVYAEILDAVNTGVRSAYDFGCDLANLWETEIAEHGKAHFSSRLKEYRTRASEAFVALGDIAQRNQHLPDIANLLWDRLRIQSVVFGGIQKFTEAVNALPDLPSRETIGLVRPARDEFVAAVAAHGQWVRDMIEIVSERSRVEASA